VNHIGDKGLSIARQIRFEFLRGQRRDFHGAGYSKDLRVRAVSIVEGGESAREAGRLLSIGASTAIRWIDRWMRTALKRSQGRVTAARAQEA
jgi:hypothetical protein